MIAEIYVFLVSDGALGHMPPPSSFIYFDASANNSEERYVFGSPLRLSVRCPLRPTQRVRLLRTFMCLWVCLWICESVCIPPHNGRFSDKPVRWQDISLTTRPQTNALVDAVAISLTCQRNVLSADWLVSETSLKPPTMCVVSLWLWVRFPPCISWMHGRILTKLIAVTQYQVHKTPMTFSRPSIQRSRSQKLFQWRNTGRWFAVEE